MEQPIRIIVADDHPVVLFALEQALAPYRNIQTVGHASDWGALVALLSRQPCDVVVTDFTMPRCVHGEGLEMLGFLCSQYTPVAIAVLSMVQNPALICEALRLGVSAFISKSDDIAHVGAAIVTAAASQRYIGPNIQRALDEVGEGGPQHLAHTRLTRREIEVLRLYLAGERISSIATTLERSVKTVSAQRAAAMRKLGATNDADLFEYARLNEFGVMPLGWRQL